MNKLDIIEMHKNCLDFLLKWQLEYEDFYFMPRKINNSGRLDNADAIVCDSRYSINGITRKKYTTPSDAYFTLDDRFNKFIVKNF